MSCILPATFAAAVSAADYQNHEDMTESLLALTAEHRDACRLETYGTSRNGRELWVLRLGRGDGVAERSAMIVVAGIDGDFPVTSATALRAARAMLESDEDSTGRELLRNYKVYIIPRANPDAMEAYFQTPQLERRAALRAWDDDRDGLVDEDGPEDLNGDGLITMMRVPVVGRLRDKLEATHLPDPKEPRLLKKADRARGEKPIYAAFPEGIDDDGDEAYNEDGIGGVDINRNFLHGYKEHDPGNGPHQISEPESKALIDFFFEHPRIAIAVFYGRHDNVVEAPQAERPKGKAKPQESPTRRSGGGRGFFRMRERPKAPTTIHKDDAPIYTQISKAYRKITGIEKVPSEPHDGAVFGWAYAQYGIPSFACRVWTRPKTKDDEKPGGPDEKTEDGEGGDASADGADDTDSPRKQRSDKGSDVERGEDRRARRGGGGGRGPKERGKGKKKEDDGPANKEAAAWLKYSDEQRDGAGFVAWTPFDHPQLGRVEIGGFVPFFRTTPPIEEVDAIAEKQLAFLLDLGGRFPRISLEVPRVTRLSDTLYEVETALVNDGYFPSGLAIAKQNRRVRPIVVRLDVPRDRIVGGELVERVWSIPGSGGRHSLRWLVRGDPDSVVTVRATSRKYGNFSHDVKLTATVQEGGGS